MITGIRGYAHQLALVWLTFAALYMLTGPGYVYNSDGRSMFEVSRSLLNKGSVAVPEQYGVPGPDGHFYSKYGIGLSIVALPFLAVGQVMDSVRGTAGSDLGPFSQMLLSWTNAFITASSAVLLVCLVYELGYTRRVGILVGLIYGLSTMAWPYASNSFSEPLVAALFVGSLVFLAKEHRSGSDLGGFWALVAASVLAGATIMVRVSAVVLIVPVSLFVVYDIWIRWKRKSVSFSSACFALISYLAPIAMFVGLQVIYNYLRFGSLLETGYSYEGAGLAFHRSVASFLYGLYGLLLSPGRSVFLYSLPLLPALLFWPRFVARQQSFGWLLITVFLANAAFHANLIIGWMAGWCWGPRFMLPVVFVGLLPLAELIESWPKTSTKLRYAVLFIIALGIAINLTTVLVSYRVYLAAIADSGQPQLEQASVEQLNASPLVVQWRYAASTFGSLATPINPQRDRQIETFRLPYPYVWPVLAYRLRLMPVGIVFAAVAAMGSVLAAAVFGLWRSIGAAGTSDSRHMPSLSGSALGTA